MNQPMKQCPHCGMTIPATGYICPYCRKRADQSAFLNQLVIGGAWATRILLLIPILATCLCCFIGFAMNNFGR